MVDAYLKGEDEKEVNIVTSIKILGLKLKKEPLATLHRHYRKYEQDYGAAEAIQLMTETADEYHEQEMNEEYMRFFITNLETSGKLRRCRPCG